MCLRSEAAAPAISWTVSPLTCKAVSKQCDLLVGNFAIHHRIERGGGFVERKIFAGGEAA